MNKIHNNLKSLKISSLYKENHNFCTNLHSNTLYYISQYLTTRDTISIEYEREYNDTCIHNDIPKYIKITTLIGTMEYYHYKNNLHADAHPAVKFKFITEDNKKFTAQFWYEHGRLYRNHDNITQPVITFTIQGSEMCSQWYINNDNECKSKVPLDIWNNFLKNKE